MKGEVRFMKFPNGITLLVNFSIFSQNVFERKKSIRDNKISFIFIDFFFKYIQRKYRKVDRKGHSGWEFHKSDFPFQIKELFKATSVNMCLLILRENYIKIVFKYNLLQIIVRENIDAVICQTFSTSTDYFKFSFFPNTVVLWNALPGCMQLGEGPGTV